MRTTPVATMVLALLAAACSKAGRDESSAASSAPADVPPGNVEAASLDDPAGPQRVPADFAVVYRSGPVAGWEGGAVEIDLAVGPDGQYRCRRSHSAASPDGRLGRPGQRPPAIPDGEATVAPERALELYRLIVREGFFALDERHADAARSNGWTASLLVTADGTTHMVTVSNTLLEPFARIEKAVLALAERCLGAGR